jgi:hypothetical protein
VKQIDRRSFLTIAATGTAAAAAAAAATVTPLSGILTWLGDDTLKFRAVAGLPKQPLPMYASFVVDGSVNLARGTGTVVKSLYAGAPDAMSNILFPGTARTIRVTSAKRSGEVVSIAGVVDDSQKIGPRESRTISILIDQIRKVAKADFLGSAVTLQVQ